MDLTPYVDSLRNDLAAAAEAGSAEIRDAAERLSYAVEPSLRMVLLEALGLAAAEITDQLGTAVVDVRLRGRDPELIVTEPPAAPHPPPPPPPPAPPVPPEPDEGMARISLRLPESLKTRAEEAAAAAGQSVNAWLVRAVSHMLDEGRAGHGLDISSVSGEPGIAGRARPTPQHRVGIVGQRLTGWQR